ncbi:hypothetical protein BHE74_00010669 [Ensete ventricosum]|nr:hypothetical protein BHE74_00010669 [Ensete ventricosum]
MYRTYQAVQVEIANLALDYVPGRGEAKRLSKWFGWRGLLWYEKGVIVDWEESKELLEEEGVVAIGWEGKREEEGEGVVEVEKLNTGGWQGWEGGLRREGEDSVKRSTEVEEEGGATMGE